MKKLSAICLLILALLSEANAQSHLSTLQTQSEITTDVYENPTHHVRGDTMQKLLLNFSASYVNRLTDLAPLSTGLLKNTTGTGVLSHAVGGTDYELPLTFLAPLLRSTNTISPDTSAGSKHLATQYYVLIHAGGTVTNVSTGFGLLGGPITNAGTAYADSSKLATHYYVLSHAGISGSGSDRQVAYWLSSTVTSSPYFNWYNFGHILSLTGKSDLRTDTSFFLSSSSGAHTLSFMSDGSVGVGITPTYQFQIRGTDSSSSTTSFYWASLAHNDATSLRIKNDGSVTLHGSMTIGTSANSATSFECYANGGQKGLYWDNNTLHVFDYYGASISGVGTLLDKNFGAALQLFSTNSQLGLITNQSIILNPNQSTPTYQNSDAADGNFNHLGTNHVAIKYVTNGTPWLNGQPTTSLVGGFMMYADNHSGANTAAPFFRCEDGTVIDLEGLSGGAGVTSVTGTSPIASSGGTTPAISIANAAADGSTKGAASFAANDFDASSGNISIDYTNGQAADASHKGFLTSSDWSTFNGKLSSYTETDPIVKAINGLVKSNGTTISAAIAGTDYVTGSSTNTFTNKSGNISQWTNDANYLTANQSITLSGDVTGSGSTSITTTLSRQLAPTAVKTGNYTASVNDFVPCDNTSGSFTVTLPTAPADKSIIGVKLVILSGTNTISIAAGGSDVFNKASGGTSLTLSLMNQAFILQYKASGAIWYVLSTDAPTSAFILSGATAGGDLTGTYPNPTIAASAVTNSKIANSTIDVTTKITGTVPVANGGTGVTSASGSGSSFSLTTNPTFSGFTLADATNIVFNTTTGTKIGTSTSQKLSFYNSTPIVQPSGSLITALQNLGLIASATLAESELSFTNITTNNVTSTKHGFAPVAPADATEYLNGAATPAYAVPPKFQTQIIANNASGSTTTYMDFGNPAMNATEANKAVVVPVACTLYNLYLITTTSQPGTGSMVITLRKNSGATACTITIAASASAGTFSDTGDPITFSAGDTFDVQIVNNASTASATIQSFALAFK